ncbi:uncharacterized protein ASPGLDRAFT_43894 [Aspergillus glaucus CBS 516.65]|uniref:Uncharacterized protein n=1 Tax=Aspergillus glaucus CBS 516.65 TaxID=1160497 RepID=A0A1L9VTU7_ASPGL|nr:hypothetical protein ASPGLDRAFT_43894 [Aspergillus glaucus CBS 516.65]OJJ87351.1 hypothetical protein ASPGLDRAFT_43894 [Aspergillus glaucus CBS 516.65]
MGVAKGNRSSASGDVLVIVSLSLPAIVLFVTRNSIPFTTVMSGCTNLTIQADEYPKLVNDPPQTLADHYSNRLGHNSHSKIYNSLKNYYFTGSLEGTPALT